MTMPISMRDYVSAGGADDAVVPIAQRLGSMTEEIDKKPFDALYALMKAHWEANSSIDAQALIDLMVEFTKDDGTKPFAPISTHTSTLMEIMMRAKADGGEDLPVYKELYAAQVYSFAGNIVLENFVQAMLVREEYEPW
ncbi:hypothetical protein K6W16_20005 [Burkholderia dolosa]|uniref:Uncharacterized protein n=1 Tax=Burkholderia dolosa TaxID=152500 RepID=A0A892IH93_9BURK|nr:MULTISPECIES: hypothetical protein [Burkholderia]AKE05319.1 hypothetical protein XM57_21805 [Burkholderia cepacia]AJY10520.1 hypothetical protein AK34_4722 [Burkholderia dolosa AU0158]AYZ94370.1 hypothetical protein EGY28_04425 [Burkholderia dolosa]ETP63865.1 hypothetical protein BDSB_25660 [Burkholderia dolosa PC543]MBR8415778.1 hypothetical protein [Burkholderia dolosa]